jgi:Cu/Ag efflux pump CusA
VQDWIVAPQLKTLKGVAGVDVLGGYVKQYVVQPDPAKLSAFGISLPQLIDALEHANRVEGAGYVQRGGEAYIVRADARVKTLGELAETPVGRRGSAVIRVSDVATVVVGQAPRLGSASEAGREVVIGTALMLAGENSRTVAARVGERLKDIQASLPAGWWSSRCWTAPTWSTPPSARSSTTWLSGRCWSSRCCSWPWATFARRSSPPWSSRCRSCSPPSPCGASGSAAI